ncbi:MAG TPA: phosphatase PAP2 family protein, partial [Thermoanaerobaculia bacterium]|nr:phosphatase PAP2 family protein [Thermoanaerobaculia bacterium]
FYVVNVVSTIAWATAHIVSAVIAGATLAVAGAVGGRLLVLILVLGVVLWLIVLLVRAAVGRGVPLIARGAVNLWLWARHHDNWVSREILSLLDPSQDELKGLLLLAGFLALGLWAFFGILSQVVTGDPLQRMDSAVFNFMQDTRTLWADRLMVILTELGDPVVTGAVALAVALWLAARGTWRAAGYWLGALAVASAFAAGLALILHLPRPTPLEGAEGALGLVSSHTAVAGTVYSMLALFVGFELQRRGRLVLAVPIASLVFLIAFSRLYLGVRWTSDVGVGLAFALAWVAGLGLVYLSHRPRSIAPGALLAILLPVFAVVGTYHARATFTADMQRYAARPISTHMAVQDWWRS